MWMTEKRFFNLSSRAIAIRLDLIAKVHGIEQAENYFSNVPIKLRALEVYGAFLNCYARVKHVEKAKAIMQKIRDLGLDRTTVSYNVLHGLQVAATQSGKRHVVFAWSPRFLVVKAVTTAALDQDQHSGRATSSTPSTEESSTSSQKALE